MKKLWDQLVIRCWRKRQQAIDLEILWPTFCEVADVERARFAFRLHMQMDPAYGYMTDAERDAYADQLRAPTP